MKYSLGADRRLSLNSGVLRSAGQGAGLPKRMANGLLAGLAALAIVWGMQSGRRRRKPRLSRASARRRLAR